MTDVQAGRQDEWIRQFSSPTDDYFFWLSDVLRFVTPDNWQDIWVEADGRPEDDMEPDEACRRIGTLCTRGGTDLAAHDNNVVGRALNYVLGGTFCDMPRALISPDVSRELRHAAISSVTILYRDVFEPRCKPLLAHLNQGDDEDDLGFIAYMLWDISPIGFYSEDFSGRDDVDMVLGVLFKTLDSPNIACVESGLHGLNHMVPRISKARDAIDGFLARSDVPDALRTYALGAREGLCI